MIKTMTIVGLSLSLASPAIAESLPPKSELMPCIEKEFSGSKTPPPKTIEITDSIEHNNVVYYRFHVVAVNDMPWTFYISHQNKECSLVSSGFPNPYASLLGMPKDLARRWVKRNIERRIEEVGEEKFKQDIKANQNILDPIELEVVKSLGLLD